MSWTMPEVIIRRVIDDSFRRLRLNKPAFLNIFADFTKDELNSEYGANYSEQIWQWFATTKIPIVQGWAFNAQKIPSISVHLANEQEAEDKIAFDDFAGTFDDETTTGTAAFTVMLDIGIHANKGGDHVLWLYYILAYILFKNKPALVRLGLEMGTFSASDYSRDAEKMGNNVWTRWVRYRCTTQSDWPAEDLTTIEEVNLDAKSGIQADDFAASSDVDISEVDTSTSEGMRVGRIGDTSGEDDLDI